MDSGFLQVFAVGVAVAVAPGPDFFMVLRNSLTRGRLAGVMTPLQKLIVHPNKGSPKIETERVAGAELKIFDL